MFRPQVAGPDRAAEWQDGPFDSGQVRRNPVPGESYNTQVAEPKAAAYIGTLSPAIPRSDEPVNMANETSRKSGPRRGASLVGQARNPNV